MQCVCDCDNSPTLAQRYLNKYTFKSYSFHVLGSRVERKGENAQQTRFIGGDKPTGSNVSPWRSRLLGPGLQAVNDREI